jgi:cell division protease FtsH
MLLAGSIAEKLILKESYTGSQSDLAKATALSQKLIKQYGMSKLKASLGHPSIENQISKLTISPQQQEQLSLKILKKAHKKAKKCLKQNLTLLTTLSKKLTKTNKLSKPTISKLINKYKSTQPTKFNKPKKQLKKQ